MNHLTRVRVLADAEQHQRRLERHRGKGIRRHRPNETVAFCHDYRHAGDELADRLAKRRTIECRRRVVWTDGLDLGHDVRTAYHEGRGGRGGSILPGDPAEGIAFVEG